MQSWLQPTRAVSMRVRPNPLVPFGTRVMVNLTPAPRNAFLPRAMPATCFGPCETIPDALWVYQGGKVVPKVNVQVAGLQPEELVVVNATWDDYETPIAALPPPDAAAYDASAVQFPEVGGVAALLPEEDLPEHPPEDGNVEEKPPPVLTRLEELAEELDIPPPVVPFADDPIFEAAAARAHTPARVHKAGVHTGNTGNSGKNVYWYLGSTFRGTWRNS